MSGTFRIVPHMTEMITTSQFYGSVGSDGWRLIAGGPAVYYPTTSLAAGAELVKVIAEAGTAGGHQPHVDLRPAGVTVQLPILGPEGDGFSSEYVELAERISAAAAELTLIADPSQLQTLQFSVDAMSLPAVAPFWRAVLGGYVDRDNEYDLIDPRWRSPAIDFQQMDAPRPQRNRVHVNLYLPYDQAEPRIRSALAAGGHIVTAEFAPYWWVLADSEGNEVCIAPVGGLPGEVPVFE
jgi:4a-hydroxytetrahydrobiopterin dehydratase